MPTLAQYGRRFQALKDEIGKVIIGQQEMVEVMILTLLAKGHILLEGVPGLAKSLAVETFARVIGGEFRRFQFTPDKMPSDITGTMVYSEQRQQFDFHHGPIFCNVFLADEINRASPKVQSALLQAMQEKTVDVERRRFELPQPFIVLATQNPIEQLGTYPLAEAQVDRFMVKYDVTYPARQEEAELLARKHRDFEVLKAGLQSLLTPDEVLSMQAEVHQKVEVTSQVMAYLLNICTATRPTARQDGDTPGSDIHQHIRLGASPRASEFLLALTKALAFCQGRAYVNFDDVNRCAVHVLRHRILLTNAAAAVNIRPETIIAQIIKRVSPY